MQRGESVPSDPRKALSRCLDQEEAGQAGTAVTLKLAQPLHMPQEAIPAQVCLRACTSCPGILASPAWSSWGSGHCSPPTLKPSLVLFSPSSRVSQTLALAKTLSIATVCQTLG